MVDLIGVSMFVPWHAAFLYDLLYLWSARPLDLGASWIMDLQALAALKLEPASSD